MEKEGRSLVISTFLFLVLILIGVSQSLVGFAVAGETATDSPGMVSYFKDYISPRLVDIVKSPFDSPEMLWIAIPLLLVILFMQVYFGRWRNERLGWASAFANWITLLFVAVNLFREMLVKYSVIASAPPSVIYILPAIPLGQQFIPLSVLFKFMLIFALFFISILFMSVLFLHAIPKKASFLISSPLAIYSFAFIMIAVVYSDIPLDLPTFLAALLVYILILIIFKIIKMLIPPSQEAKRYLKEKEKMEKKKKGIEKAVKTKKIRGLRKRYFNFFRKRRAR
ncbi:hypothetical protein ACFLZZ_04145 [Nanoarchaeota archaeon]